MNRKLCLTLPADILLLFLTLPVAAQEHDSVAPGLTSTEFVSTIERLSEPTGDFDSDNYISNETGYLYIIPKLAELKIKGGVYIGVGPEQNFTYIAQLRPEIAFILDIRRDNLLEHLIFKAIFGLSRSRAEFLSLLLSKPSPTPDDLSGVPSIAALVSYFDGVDGQDHLFSTNHQRIRQAIESYKLDLSDEDYEMIKETLLVFRERHLDLRWEYKTDGSRGITFPSFREMLLSTDLEGVHRNFLNSDTDFYYLKDMQARNLVVPLTGDFAGDAALKNIGNYTRQAGMTVSAFYLSNVEYYLVPDGLMSDFAENVKSLPTADNTVLIRAFVNLSSAPHPARVGAELMTTLVQYVASFRQKWDDGVYGTYLDVGAADYIQ